MENSSVIYQMFIRDYTKEGTFKKAEEKLEEVRKLDVDIIQLLPFHPIGKIGRKGTYGSPYAIQDYEKVSEDLGTLEDLRSFVRKAHSLSMRVVMDVVFNHTSRDSKLLKTHPEWFYRNEKGEFANKVGDWSDVYDLNHSAKGLDEYLVSVLKKYVVEYGIDGFRFDVASLIPLDFYRLLRKTLDPIRDDLIYIGEAVDTAFLLESRSLGFVGNGQQELLDSGLDILYPYDIWQWFRGYLENQTSDHKKAMACLRQYEALFDLSQVSIAKDKNHVMSIENHDQRRLASYSKDRVKTMALLSYTFFPKGPAFLLMGEENLAEEQLDFFEKEDIDLNIKDRKYYDFLLTNIKIKRRKKNDSLLVTWMHERDDETLFLTNHYQDGSIELGVFPLGGKQSSIRLDKEYDGTYLDLLTQTEHTIKDGMLMDIDAPLILSRI